MRLEGTKMRPSPTQIRMSGQFEATWATNVIYIIHHFLVEIQYMSFEFTNWRISLGEDVSSFPLIVFEDKLSDLTDS